MEKLPMCRICLTENVRMHVVLNKNLHELYEKLTDIPFVTEDSRPILACSFCCAKLKQCYRLMRQCLEAEDLLAQMMNEDYEPNPLINQDHFWSGFIKSPTVYISINDECQTENIAIKEELPAECEGLDAIIEPKEEHQSDGLEPENSDNSYLDVTDIPPHHSESYLEYDVPILDFKTEVEEVFEKKGTARKMTRPTVAKKPKLDTRRTKLEDAITAEQMNKEKLDSKIIQTTLKRTSKSGTLFKEPYKCDQRNFNRVKKMVLIPTQIGEKPKCAVRQHSFSHKGDLTKHTGEKPYKCDVCQSSFSRNVDLTNHIRIHTGEKPYKCDVCPRSFTQKGNLTKHIRIHTGEKPYKCDVCQRSFRQKIDVTKHIRIHTGEKPYKCDVCQNSFRTNFDLTNHIRIHTGEKPYKCDICQNSFCRKFDLTNHIRKHTGEKPYKCDVCHRSFSSKRNLTQHIRLHSGDKPYKCDICQRSFSEKACLSKHIIRIHTCERPYKCDECQRCFSEKNYLTKHSRIHTGKKTYKCNVCWCNFSQKSKLTEHYRVHSGEKPYE